MERGVERSFPDAEHFPGELFDPARDGVSVRRPPGQRLEDEEIEGSLEAISWPWHIPIDGRCMGRVCTRIHRLSMGHSAWHGDLVAYLALPSLPVASSRG